MGKKYDLANPTGDEFTFRMVCYNGGQEEAVGFIVIREYGETNSYVGIDPWEPTDKGSCFTSGKIESSFDPQKKTCKIEVAGVLKNGSGIAIMLNGAYLDD